jgi:hypothetical protein
LILRLNLKTPGREESEIKLYSKADYQARAANQRRGAADTKLGRPPASCRRWAARQYRKHQQLRHPTAHRAGRYGENAKRRRL